LTTRGRDRSFCITKLMFRYADVLLEDDSEVFYA